MRKDYSDTTIIAPTLNEKENIAQFLNTVTRMYPGISIIVPDDGSKDSTDRIVKRMSKKNRRIRLLDRSRKGVHGTTASILDAALQVRTPKTISMDADFQHPLNRIKKLSMGLDMYDLVIGVRHGHGKRSFTRRALSKAMILLALVVYKIRGLPTCSDMASGYFAIRTEIFKGLIRNNERAFVYEGNKTLLDILRIIGNKTRIGEVGYPNFPERKRGKSKFKPRIVTLAFRSIMKW